MQNLWWNLRQAVVFALVVFVCLVAGYAFYDLWQVEQSASMNNADFKLAQGGDSDDIKWQESENMIAWIRIDDTNIHHPIMHGRDNKWYLTHDWQEQYSTAGSVFLDYRNDANFHDDYIVIYGHRMSRGLMFSDIGNFADEKYFNEHESGVIFVPSGEFKLETVAFLRPRIDSVLYDVEGRIKLEARDNLEDVLDFADLVNYEAIDKVRSGREGKLIVLSTCSRDSNKTRDALVMFAVRVK